MLLKDYYKILEVPPAAGRQEIKRAFRRLVLIFHPDRNGGDALAEARFRDIREAYEILSNPRTREEYNYKRWYNRSMGKPFEEAPLSPGGILLESERLDNYVRGLTGPRVEYDALSYHIRHRLLNGENIRLLRRFNDQAAGQAIVGHIIRSCHSLPWQYIEPIGALLREVAGEDPGMKQAVADFLATHRAGHRWNRYRVWMVLIVTALLCALIYFFGR